MQGRFAFGPYGHQRTLLVGINEAEAEFSLDEWIEGEGRGECIALHVLYICVYRRKGKGCEPASKRARET